GSGNPNDPDFEPREARGMATKFYLDDGTTTDLIGITLPAFFVCSLDGFFDLCRARTPDAATGEPDPAAIGAFLEQHPEALTAGDGDAVDDPSIPWPEERERATIGRLEITGLAHDREQGDDVLVFDPTRVTGGIELSDDPILRFRTHAYAESVLRRTGVARDG